MTRCCRNCELEDVSRWCDVSSVDGPLCNACYQAFRKHGTFLRVRTSWSVARRWLEDVVGGVGEECVDWPFGRSGDYGLLDGRLATHVALEMDGRPWHPPLGPAARHSCDRPICVNPRHLAWGTQARNFWEAVERGRLDPTSLSDMGWRARWGDRISDERIVALIADRQLGLSYKVLGERHGMSKAHARYLVIRHTATSNTSTPKA